MPTARTRKQTGKTRKAKGRGKRTQAQLADRHALYQNAVQDPAHDVKLVDRVFRKETGRRPMTLREDFCGTAYMCATWVKSHRERTAVGIDLHGPTLRWGMKHNIEPLGEDAERVTLLEQDVRASVRGRFDVCQAFNYSYFVFEERDELREYFEAVRDSLEDDGLFFLDMYGGPETQEEKEEIRSIGKGIKYVWDQDYVNPIDMHVTNHIHFLFPDGSEKRRAFTYEWRLWSCPEIQELLEEAGFEWVDFYFEDEDEDGDPTGTFRAREVVPADLAWINYVVAGKSPKRKRPKRRGTAKKK